MTQQRIDLVSAAARLRISWHTAYRLVLTGVLDGERLGGRWYVDPRSVERFRKISNKESRHMAVLPANPDGTTK
jgi:hypothetical protein